MSDDPRPEHLAPTEFLDFEAPAVRAFAAQATAAASSPREQAARLFLAIRDGFRYDPYTFSVVREDYRASAVVERDAAFCIPKAILLAACARSVGVPARLGFADVRNHLASDRLRQLMGTDLFAFHGYAVLWIEGRWFKATPAFNLQMCDRFAVLPLEFDGTADALFHPFDAAGRKHMEYVRDRGVFDDLPFDGMMTAMAEVYGGQMAAAIQAAAGRPDPMFE